MRRRLIFGGLSSPSGRRKKGAKECGSSGRSEEHTSELQSRSDLVCRLLLEKKKINNALLNNGPEKACNLNTPAVTRNNSTLSQRVLAATWRMICFGSLERMCSVVVGASYVS